MSLLLEAGDSRLGAEGTTLSVTGGVDFEGAAELANTGSQWLAQQPPGSTVVLDLGGVDRISSAAISVMLEWLRVAEAKRLTVQAVELSPPLLRLAEVAGIDSLLPAQTTGVTG
jgi:phospholipid transport system transporter-binding protein